MLLEEHDFSQTRKKKKKITKKILEQSFPNLLRILHSFLLESNMKPLQDVF